MASTVNTANGLPRSTVAVTEALTLHCMAAVASHLEGRAMAFTLAVALVHNLAQGLWVMLVRLLLRGWDQLVMLLLRS